MPRLLVIKGTDEGKQFELSEPRVGIGRDMHNTIRLHDTEVSRRHAEIQTSGEIFVLHDLDSANGTFVNSKQIKESPLHAGDRIQIGQTILVYSTGRGETESSQMDLADQINMISRHDLEIASAIVKTVPESEGSQILSHPDAAPSAWLKEALANLTIMYEASQAVSHILDLKELLDRIMDLIFRRIAAERGCMWLHNPETGELEPRAVRFRDGTEPQQKMNLSRTIVEYVLQQKQGVLVTDAAQDDRFSGQSIVRLGIREVICVPMKGRHESLGVLYLDTRYSAREVAERKTAVGKFTEDHLRLAIAIAHQTALAVEETRLHQAMVHAERLAAIGQTIAHLSHHIKNILQGLKSGSDILRMGIQGKEENLLLQGWKIVEKNQGKIEDIVIDMLSYSKEREPAIEDTSLNGIVQDVFELMARRAEELGVKLSVDVDPNLPIAQVDPEGIHRALLNIVSNALDAVEGRPNPKVVIGTRPDADPAWVRILVRDNGTGIPSEKLRDIFKPFVSTKGAKGTGLGLAVSQKTLREHGGDILVESQVGKGSKFILRLPVRSALSQDLTGANLDILPPPEEE